MRLTEIAIAVWALRTVFNCREKNQRKNRNHPDRSITKTSKNTSLGDLRRLSLTQTPVKDH